MSVLLSKMGNMAVQPGRARGDGQGTRWISSAILGRSKQAIHSDVSWKETAVLVLSATLICSAVVILRWALFEKMENDSLRRIFHLPSISQGIIVFPPEQQIKFLLSFAVRGSLRCVSRFLVVSSKSECWINIIALCYSSFAWFRVKNSP